MYLMNFILEKGGKIEVVLAFKDDNFISNHKELYDFIKEKGIFKGNEGEVYTNLSMNDDSVICLGLGDEKKLDFQAIRKSF